jgi:streptogramin lyase
MNRTWLQMRKSVGALALVGALGISATAGCVVVVDGPRDLPWNTAAELPMQSMNRFPVGSTYYLKTFEAGKWLLESAPSLNTNTLVAGNDGFTRFTPVISGTYVFRLDGTEETQRLTVVDQVPFEHFTYYQTSSMADVDGEIWVANLFDPHISRIDSASGTVKGKILTGPWPSALAFVKSRNLVLVTHKAGDTLGFVDVTSGQLVDAVWVGDEPADVVVSPDGTKAYVSLVTEGAIVVVDLAKREVTGRLTTNKNATKLALSEDGSTLFVASYCSGVSERLQFPVEKRNDQFDIAIVDTNALTVTGYIESVGSMLGGLWATKDKLYVSTTRVAITELTTQEGMTAFRHSVAAYDLATKKEIVGVDVGRQASSKGLAVRPFGMTLANDTLWVAFEGNDLVVGLDPETLAEKTRFAAEGRPRSIFTSGDKLYVHGAQEYAVTIAKTDGTVDKIVKLEGDPRGSSVKLGQALYTGTGAKAGVNHSCADCHVDSITDGNVWSAGFSESASRPMFWMERESAIGWEGDAHDLFSYLYGSPAPTIGVTVNTEQHRAFYDFLATIVPPPPGNGKTMRDGSMTETAKRGEAIFRGKGNCAGCHAGPFTSDGLRLEGGGTQTTHPIIVPSLVGAYRHGWWLVNGAAWTMDEAVEAMTILAGTTITAEEKKDVVQYLDELTARDFFILNSSPRDGATNVRNEGDITVTLSHPLYEATNNLNLIELRDKAGTKVKTSIKGSGRHVTITPSAPLEFGAEYDIVIMQGFEAFDEMKLAAEHKIHFTVGAAPTLKLEGNYTVNIDHPFLDFEKKDYVPTPIIPVTLPMVATSTGYGATIKATPLDGLVAPLDVAISGNEAFFPPFPFQVGPAGFMNRSFPTQITLVDMDSDGIADSGESTLTLRGPGLEAKDVRWTIKRDGDVPMTCDGMTGTHAITLETDANGLPTVSWMAAVNALGYYVTDVDAKTPLGPGPVTGGTTYWAVGATAFPTGFAGPIAYGMVPAGASDATAASGGMAGGSPIPSKSCVKLTLVFNDFSTTVMKYVTP